MSDENNPVKKSVMGRPRSKGSGRVTRYLKPQGKRRYQYRFEIPTLWFKYLALNSERYRFDLDAKNKRIIISVPTDEEVYEYLSRRDSLQPQD